MLWGHCDDPCRFAIGFSNKLICLFTCIYLNLLLTEPFSALITDAVIVAVGRAAAAAARVPALCARLPELVRLTTISFEVKTLLNFSIIYLLKTPLLLCQDCHHYCGFFHRRRKNDCLV
jgi:hypothetical protein